MYKLFRSFLCQRSSSASLRVFSNRRTMKVEQLFARTPFAADFASAATLGEPANLAQSIDMRGTIDVSNAVCVAVDLQNTISILAEPTKNLNEVNRSEDLRVRSSNMSPPTLEGLKSEVDLVLRAYDDSSEWPRSTMKGAPRSTFSYWRVGSPTDASVTSLSSGLALVGGGLDVDEAFRWLGSKAGGGDFLVLRATGTDAYNPYIDGLVDSLNSVATLLIPDRASALDSRVSQIIQQAEVIFLAGGDQADYLNYWNGTPVEQAIYAAVERGAALGGTSAGLAVLGDFDFTAQTGKTITSNEALLNPYDSRITIDDANGPALLSPRDLAPTTYPNAFSLLSLLTDTITDSHFRQRDRMGRLVTLMARLDADGRLDGNLVRGIGINEQTALLVDSDGFAKVIGNSSNLDDRSVYFLEKSVGTSRTLTAPLTYTDVTVRRVDAQVVPTSFHILSLAGYNLLEEYRVSSTGRLASRRV